MNDESTGIIYNSLDNCSRIAMTAPHDSFRFIPILSFKSTSIVLEKLSSRLFSLNSHYTVICRELSLACQFCCGCQSVTILPLSIDKNKANSCPRPKICMHCAFCPTNTNSRVE